MKIRTVFTLCIGVVFALIAGRTFWSARSFGDTLGGYHRLVEREDAIDSTVARVAEIAIDLETGVRGWQLTGDVAFRQPYDEASRDRDRALGLLADLLRADADDGATAERLRGRLAQWDSEIAAPLLRLPANALGSAGGRALTIEGKRRMDEIRSDLAYLRRGIEARSNAATGAFEGYQRDLRRAPLLITGALLTVLLALWAVIARAIEHPLAKLVEHAHRVAGGEFVAIEVRGVAEARSLATAWNWMVERLAAERERERRFTTLVEALAARSGVRGVAEAALRSLVDVQSGEGAALWVVGRGEEGRLDHVASVGGASKEFISDAEAHAREAAISGRQVRVDDETQARGATGLGSVLFVPISAGKSIVGVIARARASGAPATLEDDLTRASTRIGLALESAIASERSAELASALAGQQARLETAFLVLTDGILVVNESGVIQLANRAAQQLFGGAVTGRHIEALGARECRNMPDGTAIPSGQTITGTCLERQQPLHNVFRTMIAANGGQRTVCVNAVPIPGSDHATGAVVAVRDVTEDHALRETLARANDELRSRNEELMAQEEELRAQSVELAANQTELTLRNDELARASRLKSDFLASMSHELRTPLNAVIGFSDLLLAGDYGPLDSKQSSVVQDVLSAGQQLLTLINDVLDLSKIEAGRVEVRVSPIDVAEPVDQAYGLVVEAARKRSIRIVNGVSTGRLFASADPDRLRQVVINLISNAVKFTPDGGMVTIAASSTAERVRVAVTDTGIGIAASDAPKLFSPFSQLDSGYTRRFQGTGLGLSICKQLVELMGGEIGFTSEPGTGSTFYFTLPVARERRALTPWGMAAVRSIAPPASPQRRTGARPTVLLVEDEERDGRVIEGGLRREGYVVARARTAEEALAAVDHVKPGLFIVDLGLPGLSGFGLVDRIRALPAHERTPIAVLSARDLTGEDSARLAASVQLIAQKGDASRTGFFAQLGKLGASRLRVLLVDDSELNRKVIRTMLQRAPCEVIEVADALSGIRAAREQAPAVILMDIQMPGMDGLSATAQLKADPETSEIPVIAVTAHAMEGDAARALAAGCVAYVSKPISRVRLNGALDLALGGAGWRAPSGDAPLKS